MNGVWTNLRPWDPVSALSGRVWSCCGQTYCQRPLAVCPPRRQSYRWPPGWTHQKELLLIFYTVVLYFSLYQYVQQEFTPRSFIFYLFYFLFEASHIVCTNIASILIYLALHINAEKMIFMVINLDRDRESDISSEI